MSSGEGTLYSKHRLEALSDGMFAIAMTLLILDIKVPLGVPLGGLGAALRHDGPSWLSFCITFMLTCIYWVLQHRVFDALEEVGTETAVATFVFLALVAVLPFSTSVFGHHIRDPLAYVIYFGNQFLIGVALTAKLELARWKHRVRPGSEMLRFRLYGMCMVTLSATVAAWFIPIKWLYVVPIALGLTAKRLRLRYAKRLEARAARG